MSMKLTLDRLRTLVKEEVKKNVSFRDKAFKMGKKAYESGNVADVFDAVRNMTKEEFDVVMMGYRAAMLEDIEG